MVFCILQSHLLLHLQTSIKGFFLLYRLAGAGVNGKQISECWAQQLTTSCCSCSCIPYRTPSSLHVVEVQLDKDSHQGDSWKWIPFTEVPDWYPVVPSWCLAVSDWLLQTLYRTGIISRAKHKRSVLHWYSQCTDLCKCGLFSDTCLKSDLISNEARNRGLYAAPYLHHILFTVISLVSLKAKVMCRHKLPPFLSCFRGLNVLLSSRSLLCNSFFSFGLPCLGLA